MTNNGFSAYRFSVMAKFKILRSVKSPLGGSRFMIRYHSIEQLLVGDMFRVFDTNHPLDFVVKSISQEGEIFTLAVDGDIPFDDFSKSTTVETSDPSYALSHKSDAQDLILLSLDRQAKSPECRAASEFLSQWTTRPVVNQPTEIEVAELIRLWDVRLKTLNIGEIKPVGADALIKNVLEKSPDHKVLQYWFSDGSRVAGFFFDGGLEEFLGLIISLKDSELRTSRMFNRKNTSVLRELFDLPKASRFPIERWEKSVLDAVIDATLQYGLPGATLDSRGFPFIKLCLPSSDKQDGGVSLKFLLDYCCENGLGIVFFKDNITKEPEYGFTLGELSSFKEFGTFNGDPSDEKSNREPGKTYVEDNLQAGFFTASAPTESFFPKYLRPGIRKYMTEVAKIPTPKVSMVTCSSFIPTRNLVLDLNSRDFEPDQLRNILAGVAWHLPPGRGLITRSSSLADSDFTPI